MTQAATEKPKFMMQTYIRCTQDALWEALINEEAFQHYDFLEQRAKRDGDRVTYTMPDGTVTLYTKDIEVTPKTKLVTTFEPTWAPDDPVCLIRGIRQLMASPSLILGRRSRRGNGPPSSLTYKPEQ
jgi:hypothetical protein